MNIIYIRKSNEHRSCNCCHAANYNIGLPALDSRLVDVIYEVCIGGMVPALCGDCLKKLYGAVEDTVNDIE